MIDTKQLIKAGEEKMTFAIEYLDEQLSHIRAGKANPKILDCVKVMYYGAPVPLTNVATVTVPDARTIMITPWEKKIIRDIEKGILDSELGITPENNGEVIRLGIPPLTEERRRQLVKQCKQEAENAKISVRNARRDAIEALKKSIKSDGVPEDVEKDAEAEVQKFHDKFIKKIDELYAANEKEVMTEVITELQSVTSVPLQIDTVDIPTMERAMRFYNGRPMINSVNGKKESMDAVFPLILKYGGVVVALTLDENGIPDTAEGRADIAGKIISEAGKYGILPKDIVVDVLAMTVSSDPKSAKTTLKALRLVRERFGVRTILGVSNISFGLPNRPQLNAVFYTMALQQGLSAGIINPSSAAMMQSYDSYRALMNQDENFETYICRYGQQDSDMIQHHSEGKMTMNLKNAIEKGLKQEATLATKALLSRGEDALSVIHTYIIPALDEVGKGFESGTIFLPQLLMSAETAKISFEI